MKPNCIPKPHPGQETLLALPGRIRVAVCGRRFGKTIAAALAVIRKCEKNAQIVWWISPVQEQADRVERQLIGWLGDKVCSAGRSKTKRTDSNGDSLPAPEWEHSKSEHALVHIKNGSRIEFHSAHTPDRLRGAGLDLVVIDEAADVSDYTWKMVIRPMLLDAQGEAYILGTPRGTSNWLHRVFILGQSPEHAGMYASLRLPTSTNIHIKCADLELYRREMSEEEYRQEFEAEFLDGVNAVFPRVNDFVVGEPLAVGRRGVQYITGIDLAKKQDYTVLCSVSVPDGRAEGFARFTHVEWLAQLPRIQAHLRAFPGSCVVDSTGVGDPICESIRRFSPQTYPFQFTQRSRDEIIRGLQMGFAEQRLSLARIPELIRELSAFTVLINAERPGGISRLRYAAPSGVGDDCVMALALAWYGTRMGHWGGHTGNALRDGFMG